MSHRDYRSIYVFLFLQIAFFFFQLQSSQRFVEAFALTRSGLFRGEIWRLLSFQFVTAPAFGSPAIGLFFTLLIFYIFGGAIEEAWGTAHFLTIFALGTTASAVFGIATGIPLLGGFFFEYVLLFIFAHMYPNHVFYLALILPIKVKWIAVFAGVILLLGLIRFDPYAIAAFLGASAGFGYYFLISRPNLLRTIRSAAEETRKGFSPASGAGGEGGGDDNLALSREIGKMLEEGNVEGARDRIERLRPGIVKGVNICPPADYKPEAADRYCIQCEGFYECTIRDTEASLAKETEEAAATEARRGH